MVVKFVLREDGGADGVGDTAQEAASGDHLVGKDHAEELLFGVGPGDGTGGAGVAEGGGEQRSPKKFQTSGVTAHS
jgi:hypothetical protein